MALACYAEISDTEFCPFVLNIEQYHVEWSNYNRKIRQKKCGSVKSSGLVSSYEGASSCCRICLHSKDVLTMFTEVRIIGPNVLLQISQKFCQGS